MTLACFVFGLVLVGLRFLSLPLTDAFQPYVLYAGIGLLLLGLVLVITRRSRDQMPTLGEVRPTGDVAVLEPAPPVAPPRAEVALLVGGNGASEPSVRWYQVAAATLTSVAGPKARLSVAVRGEQVGVERWQWQTGAGVVDLMQTGARIPIVIGGVRESAEPLGSGWLVP